jgi:hypothetical protein
LQPARPFVRHDLIRIEVLGARSTVAHVALAVHDQPLTLDNRLHVCPVATATYARQQGSAAAGAAGHVAFGWVARNSAGLIVVPSAAFGVRHLPDGAPDARPLEHAAEIQAAVGFILRTPRRHAARDIRAQPPAHGGS